MLKYQESLPISISIFLIFFSPLFLLSCASREYLNLKESRAQDDFYLWDFGQVKEGASLEHGFILKNSKDKPLVITGTHTSCGCTVSDTQKNQLLPGEDTRINVKFNTQGYSGPVQQYVYVHTDDISQPIIKFSVKAEVVK